MGATYSWGFLWDTFTAFRLAWPRATDLVLAIFDIVPADVLKHWRNNENNWLRFKRMVHIADHVLRGAGLDPTKLEDFDVLRRTLAQMWVKKTLLCQKIYLDIVSKKVSNFRAPMKEAGRRELATDGRQLFMVF